MSKEQQQENSYKVSLSDVLSFVWHYLKETPGKIAFVFLTVLLAIGIDLVYPYFSKIMVNAVAYGTAGKEGQVEVAFKAAISMFSLALLHHAVRISGYYIFARVICRILVEIVQNTLYKVQRLSTHWHANSFSGATVRKITRGKWAFDQFCDSLILEMLPAILIVLGMIILQFRQWYVLGIVFTVGFSIYTIVSFFLSAKYAAPAHEAFNKSDSHFGGMLADSVTCNTVVKSFGAEDIEDKRMRDGTGDWLNHLHKSWRRMIDVDQIQSVMLTVLLMSVMGFAVWRWADGVFSPGDVSYTMTCYFILNGYIRNIGGTIRRMQKAMNEMQDIILFDRMEIDIADRDDATILQVDKGCIEFENVDFSYGNRKRMIYQDFSMKIKSGEKIALVGKSGSGKSTFIKLLQRLYDVEAGVIKIDGQDVSAVTQKSLRQEISLVPQDPILFHRTLLENISYGQENLPMKDVIEAAKKAYAHDFIMSLDEGYETMVGERGIKLSGGERQRVAIARAILADKPILILDEATSSLDSISEHYIQEAVETLTQGRTTIMIAHRLSTVKKVDRILVFDDGRIVEQGTHKELLKKENGYYKALFDMQSFGLIDGDDKH